MEFRTRYKSAKSDICLNPEKEVVFAGSCFADSISAKMRESLWRAENPFGVLYNPISIANAIDLLLFSGNGVERFRKSLFEKDGVIRSWFFDSGFAAASEARSAATSDAISEAASEAMSEAALVSRFEDCAKKLNASLENAEVFFITFGTAWCYLLEGEVVANCHKMPASMFERRRLDVKDICDVWEGLLVKLWGRYPELKVVFTVSPVRHIKDGLEGNCVSKAILRLAVDELCDRFPGCSYFPAYEILNDDLRDYRFYAADMVHPSEVAVEYIWEIFKEEYLDREGIDILKEGEKIRKFYHHRPILETPEQTAQRQAKARELLRALQTRHPGLSPL